MMYRPYGYSIILSNGDKSNQIFPNKELVNQFLAQVSQSFPPGVTAKLIQLMVEENPEVSEPTKITETLIDRTANKVVNETISFC